MSQAMYCNTAFQITSSVLPTVKSNTVGAWVNIPLNGNQYNKFVITNDAVNVVRNYQTGGSGCGDDPISPVNLGSNSPATFTNYNEDKGSGIQVKTENGLLYVGLKGYSTSYNSTIDKSFYINIEATNPLFGFPINQEITNNIDVQT